MNKVSALQISVLLVVGILGFSSLAKAGTDLFECGGKTEVVKGHQIEVSVCFAEGIKSENDIFRSSLRWGRRVTKKAITPMTCVTNFKITSGKKTSYIPAAAYLDLINLNPKSMKLVDADSGSILKMEGGDAIDSYSVEFLIRKNRLVRRTVQMIESATKETLVFESIP